MIHIHLLIIFDYITAYLLSILIWQTLFTDKSGEVRVEAPAACLMWLYRCPPGGSHIGSDQHVQQEQKMRVV